RAGNRCTSAAPAQAADWTGAALLHELVSPGVSPLAQIAAILDRTDREKYPGRHSGAVAQLGEHKAGSLGVRGSSPLSSTNKFPGVTATRRSPLVVPGCAGLASGHVQAVHGGLVGARNQ